MNDPARLASSGGKSLLIVDDALIIRRRIAKIAMEVGWQVVAEAKDGEEAVVAYQNHKPRLVTMDIVMPNLDGVAALQQIMAWDANAKVVMVSAVNQKEKLAECVRCGAFDFIVKPFEAARLRDLLQRQLMADLDY